MKSVVTYKAQHQQRMKRVRELTAQVTIATNAAKGINMENVHVSMKIDYPDPKPKSIIFNLDEMYNGYQNVPLKSIVFEFGDDKFEFEREELISILKKLKGLVDI